MKRTLILLLLYFCGMACVVQTKNKQVKQEAVLLGRPSYFLKKDSFLTTNDDVDTAKVKNIPKVLHIATHGFFISDTLNTESDDLLSDTLNTQSDSLVTKIMYLDFKNTLVSLSLVDSTVFNNWDNIVKDYKRQYQKNDLLLLIAVKDSQQKADFVMTFYEDYSQSNNISKAYSKALKMTIKKYGKKLDFRHYFHKAKTN